MKRAQRIFIVGDSVAATRAEDNEVLSGWGQHLEGMLPQMDVINDSRDSATARWYFVHRLPLVLDEAEPDDIFILALGVCDQAIARPDLYATPTEYRAWLGLILDQLEAASVKAVLATQPSRHLFDWEGTLSTPAGEYSPHVRALAAERGLPLLDLQRLTGRELEAAGPESARGFYRWFDPGEHPQLQHGIIDTLHFNRWGARMVAACAARGLRDLGLVEHVAGDAEAAGTFYRRAASNHDAVAQWPMWIARPTNMQGLRVTSPEQDGRTGASVRLRGTAPRDAIVVAITLQDSVLGYTYVGEDSSWQWRHTTTWPDGKHTLHAVAIGERGRSTLLPVHFTVEADVAPPQVVRPAYGSRNGPRAVFSGSASGAHKVIALCEGRWLGQTDVKEDGSWRFQLPHDWKAGRRTIRFLAQRGGLPSTPVDFEFEVVNVPDGHWLTQAPQNWHSCPAGSGCTHIRRDKPAGAKNIIE
ncbi:GDSL-type esterase/lipase family protein [Streptomyces sp. 135]|uniref:GDSL-type esterase/lipase family protein n=1 Tax=Streptomyces sp. 135 TaxID=2838850 RepID=UPI001CBA9D18|nr:GDSL-type esterase/lipase family protein [Streptomyces sp. 135]